MPGLPSLRQQILTLTLRTTLLPAVSSQLPKHQLQLPVLLWIRSTMASLMPKDLTQLFPANQIRVMRLNINLAISVRTSTLVRTIFRLRRVQLIILTTISRLFLVSWRLPRPIRLRWQSNTSMKTAIPLLNQSLRLIWKTAIRTRHRHRLFKSTTSSKHLVMQMELWGVLIRQSVTSTDWLVNTSWRHQRVMVM